MTLDSTLVNRAVPPGSMRYYAWLYAPEAHRDVIAALFLIESELHDSAHAPHEVAHVRLQWWREEFDRLTQGKPQHPAMRALHAAGQRNNRQHNFDLLQQMHLSAAQELAKATYDTNAELEQYLRGGMGSLCQLATQLIAQDMTPAAFDAAAQLGAFIRRVETLRDLRHDFHHGRLYLPLNELDKLDIEYETLQHAVWPANFDGWLKQGCNQWLHQYQRLINSLMNTEKPALRPVLVLAALHEKLLRSLARDPQQLTRQRIELAPMQKLWTSWRAARQAR